MAGDRGDGAPPPKDVELVPQTPAPLCTATAAHQTLHVKRPQSWDTRLT